MYPNLTTNLKYLIRLNMILLRQALNLVHEHHGSQKYAMTEKEAT